jgi:hypothetical protein
MRFDRTTILLAPALLVALASGCGSDETNGPGDDHTPATYRLLVDGNELSQPYTFVSGETVRVQIKFANAAGEDLDDVEAEHFGLLTFDPATLATIVPVTDHHFQFDVTGGTAGSGTVVVSFGHDEEADEKAFDPATVSVVAGP